MVWDAARVDSLNADKAVYEGVGGLIVFKF